MRADEGTLLAGDADRADPNPWLSPVLVAEADDVNELVRTARAGIAVLSLHLRSAQHEADLASSETQDWDLGTARTFLTTTVDQQMQARRREMAAELQQARTEAARLVLSARTEAAELIAAAGEQTLDALLAGTAPSSEEAAPSLRVVTEPADVPIPEPVIAPMPPPVARPVVEPAPPPPAPPVVEPTPVVPPQPPIATEPVPVVVHEPPVATAPPADVSAQALTALVAAMVAQATTTPRPVAVQSDGSSLKQSDGSRLKQFLYLDVLLPMVAVLIVLVVLLAWIG